MRAWSRRDRAIRASLFALSASDKFSPRVGLSDGSSRDCGRRPAPGRLPRSSPGLASGQASVRACRGQAFGGRMSTRSERTLQEWSQQQRNAEAMVPIIGELYREYGVIITLFGNSLVNKSPLEILELHRIARVNVDGSM